ncbi:trypsin-like serine peptidase [Streptomyces sp. WI04-05B]|uniref:trypsin-like serine peptidase n=1 Tax=Streptomyces TaxID=1883 RepID=UPI0029B58178|nr:MULTISPECIES: peptidase [unclassified Streptomyces]MDX2544707.1 peptidase [Streptomyces sp. WI04-05B]MDX2588767.1 peptidase [Streptomyces sp. WI04-05A]MDX3749678.1 peptidase [Streptomyces sp. AK08-02]
MSPSPSRDARRTVSGLAIALLALAGPLAAPASPAAAASGTGQVSTVTYTAAERTAALSYWTIARMKQVSRDVDLGPTGPLSKPWTGKTIPSIGRLFFTDSDGLDTWCTASAVTSGNHSVIMTAAHCARLGSSPVNTHSDIVFAPGYAKGKTPYGRYAVKTTVTPRSWAEDTVNDVAAMVVATPAYGKQLTDAVGAQKIAFGRPAGLKVTSFGYPATSPQRGEQLLYCAGTTQSAPEGEQRVPCDLGGGASGGPWLAGFDSATGKGTVVSVNSHGEGHGGTPMYGPTLDKTARAVYDTAQRG